MLLHSFRKGLTGIKASIILVRRILTVLSASQVSTFGTEDFGGTTAGCQRKHAFKYFGKVPDPAGESAISGKRIHSFLERWFRDGQFPVGDGVEARAAIVMAKHMAKQGVQYPQARVEEPFQIELEGIRWRGIRDLVYHDGGTLVVHDHKTTAGLQWAKTEEELRSDVQSVLYARVAFEESDVVDLQWLYGTREKNKKKKPQVQQTRFNITFDEVQAALPPIIAAGKRVLELYKEQPNPADLKPNLAICGAYGKCPYREICPLSPLQRAQATIIQERIKEEKKMGFRDRKNAVGVATEPVQQAEVAPRPSMRDKLGFGDSITPPAFARAPADTTAAGLTAAAAVSDESSLAAAALDKPKRGRPAGVKNKAKDKTADTAMYVDEQAHHDAEQAAMQAPVQQVVTDIPVGTSVVGFLLCVDCMPGTSVHYTRFVDYIDPVLQVIQTRHEVAHYRMIDYKAAGIIAAELFTYLQTNPPTGVLVVDTRTNEGADCLATLQRFARAEFRRF